MATSGSQKISASAIDGSSINLSYAGGSLGGTGNYYVSVTVKNTSTNVVAYTTSYTYPSGSVDGMHYQTVTNLSPLTQYTLTLSVSNLDTVNSVVDYVTTLASTTGGVSIAPNYNTKCPVYVFDAGVWKPGLVYVHNGTTFVISQ